MKLPGIGSVFGPAKAAGMSDEAFFYYTSFADPGAIYRYTPFAWSASRCGSARRVPIRPEDFEVKQVWYGFQGQNPRAHVSGVSQGAASWTASVRCS
jgi:hypothetical protein